MNKITVKTNHPVAIYSPDHLFPHGTMRDNSSNPEFNKKLYELFPVKEVRLLDIGCSGGGLVKSILDDGGFAVGISRGLSGQRYRTICLPPT
jgi:2-polyprenyl-3-methyl-5-hydroxy-6-metoxy-1,4-benzoquinol methylase